MTELAKLLSPGDQLVIRLVMPLNEDGTYTDAPGPDVDTNTMLMHMLKEIGEYEEAMQE